MNTYRIRTHNPLLLVSAILVLFLSAPFVFAGFFDDGKPVNNIIAHLFGPGSDYVTIGVFTVLIMFLCTLCFFLTSTVIDATITNDSVRTTWCQSFPYFKKTDKTIKWPEILKYNTRPGSGSRWWEGIILETQNDVEYKFYIFSVFISQKSYKAFLKDFRTHASVSAGRDDRAYL